MSFVFVLNLQILKVISCYCIQVLENNILCKTLSQRVKKSSNCITFRTLLMEQYTYFSAMAQTFDIVLHIQAVFMPFFSLRSASLHFNTLVSNCSAWLRIQDRNRTALLEISMIKEELLLHLSLLVLHFLSI